jgi:peroxiredoxin
MPQLSVPTPRRNGLKTRPGLRRLIAGRSGRRFGRNWRVDANPRSWVRRKWLWVLLLTGIVAAAVPWRPRSATIDHGLRQTMPSFTLSDVRTQSNVVLDDLRGRAKAIVITFTGINCPIGDLYVPRLSELARANEGRRVVFLAINSNSHETTDQIREHARQHAIPFPVLRDHDNRVADSYMVQRTCETFVLDGNLRLRYRGAIDDQYARGSRRDQPLGNYLVEAIESVVAGRDVSLATTQVAGCPIERVTPRARARIAPVTREIQTLLDQGESQVSVGAVTYATEVASILHQKCATCHRRGQVAPFSLLTYDDARRWATSIGEVVGDRRMPPWQADPRYGVFANDRSLTPRQSAVLKAWVEQDAPAGDLAHAPPAPEYPVGWTIGAPDVVFEVPETFKVKADGTLPLQHFRVKTQFKRDMWVRAAEARPGDRAVVHHIFVYVDDHAVGLDGKPVLKRYLTGYAPGDMPSVFPEGVARKVPAGSDLTFEVHYTPIGQERHDRSSVGMVFATEPPEHEAITKGISQRKLWIPPGAKNHAERSSWILPFDAHLLSLTPHMHLRGVDFTYTATYPDGRSEVLLAVPRYDINWQSCYRLSKPKPIPRGTRIDCLAHYDNSAENHANPDPGAFVTWGEQTFDEMMIGYVDFYIDGPVEAFRSAARAN